MDGKDCESEPQRPLPQKGKRVKFTTFATLSRGWMPCRELLAASSEDTVNWVGQDLDPGEAKSHTATEKDYVEDV